MKKILNILCLTLVAFAFVGCDKENSTANQGNTTESQDNYYVKYVLGEYYKKANATMSFWYSVVDDNGNTIKSSRKNATLELVYGPVKKGFVAKARSWVEYNYGSSSGGQVSSIYVSVNNEPFSLKATGSGEISYTIE